MGLLAQQEAPDKPAEARDDHRNNHPHADDRGAKEGTHTIRVVLAHLGRDIRVVGVGSKENRSKRANPPQGKQHVCCNVSRGTKIAATVGDKVSQETENEGDRYGHPRMPCHDHEEGDDARHDRHRPKHARTHQHEHDDRPVQEEANNPADEHERRPEEAEHRRAPHEDKVDGGKRTNRDGRARLCHARA